MSKENDPQGDASYGQGIFLPGVHEGFEYHILAVALSFLILVWGAGAVSIDHLVSSQIPEEIK